MIYTQEGDDIDACKTFKSSHPYTYTMGQSANLVSHL